ncbi:MAG: hypothetical protein WBP93_04035 [Pyrinomonadaceae bacterium]
MKNRAVLLCGLLTLLMVLASETHGQGKEFVVKQLKQYWTDNNNQPWNDLSYQMAVRIDPQYAKDLGADEISIDTPPIKYATGEWRFYTLKRDAKGTYADVDYLVYKDSTDPVVYQIELQKNGKSAPFAAGSSKFEVRNDSLPNKPLQINQSNSIFLKDWLLIGGVMLAGLLLVYVLFFRWLFSGLLFKQHWAVPSAEHFTWSISLLVMLALASALTVLYLGLRLETWIIIGVMGAFWLLHAIVWLVSGKEA